MRQIVRRRSQKDIYAEINNYYIMTKREQLKASKQYISEQSRSNDNQINTFYSLPQSNTVCSLIELQFIMKQPQKQRAVLPKLPKLNPMETSCPHYTTLGQDTICFNQTCRKVRKQVSCSFCDNEQQLHHSHTQEQFAIHRTSPAFRLLSKTSSATGETILAANIEACNQAINHLQTLFQSFIDQVSKKYFNKLECLSDFLRQDAMFKICGKIRNQSSHHQECCILIINRLKDLEDYGRVADNSVEQIVLKQAQSQKSHLKEEISHISAQINELLERVKQSQGSSNEKQSVDDCQNLMHSAASTIKQQELQEQILDVSLLSKIQKEEYFNQDLENNHNQTNILLPSENPNQSSHHKRQNYHSDGRSEDIINGFVNTFEQDKNPISEVVNKTNVYNDTFTKLVHQISNMQKAQEKQLAKSFKKQQKVPISLIQLKQNKISSIEQKQIYLKYAKGIEFLNHDTIRIWKFSKNIDYYQKMLGYLSSLSTVKHVIIQSRNFSTVIKIKEIIKTMSWLEGVHMHCIYKDYLHLEKFQIKQFSLLPTYRFLKIIDKVKYFSCSNNNIDNSRKKAKIKKLKEQPFYNKMYIYEQNIHLIPTFIEQLQLFRYATTLPLSSKLFEICPSNQLSVLSFINVIFDSMVTFEHIFAGCSFLHTLVFEDCRANYSAIVDQFKYLRVFQIKHLQISCDQTDRSGIISSKSINAIFHLKSLETLILTKISFMEQQRKERSQDSSVLKGISNLRELTYLNLYSSEPVYNDLLTYMHKDCHKKMEMINIGCSQVTKGVGKLLQIFTNLKSLCVDYTCIDDEQLLDATKNMALLRFLSIENLNGKPVMYEQEQMNRHKNVYGKVTPYFFNMMKHKQLQYVNFYNCDSLKEYKWEDYTQLGCIRFNKALVEKNMIFLFVRRGITILSQTMSCYRKSENGSEKQIDWVLKQENQDDLQFSKIAERQNDSQQQINSIRDLIAEAVQSENQ